MKKLPYIIGIPAVAVLLVLGGAMLWRLKNQTTEIVNAPAPGPLPGAVGNAQGNQPSNPFSFLSGQQATATPIPTPTPASAAAMNAELQKVGDDGGAADFTNLQSQTSGL